MKTDFKKIIVEISEVNGIFTDPKVHTIDGEGYGLENLGLRGIALFFLSHRLDLENYKRKNSLGALNS